MRSVSCLLTVWVTMYLAASAAAGPQESTPESDPPLEVGGHFDLGFRWRDTSGNENKYFEHLNYRTGPRLFNLEIDIEPARSGFFDLATVFGSGLGGDPYEASGITVKKFGAYNLRYRRNLGQYFYRDTIVPHEEASVSASSGGDFHTFDFERKTDSLHFDFEASSRFNVFVDFDRQERRGESTTTLDIERDEFELDAPLRQLKNDYHVGFQGGFETFSFYFDQGYRQYRSDGRIFLPGASVGENVDDESLLFSFEQLMPLDFDMPQSTARVSVRPKRGLTVNVAFIYSSLDGQFDLSEEERGVDFTGEPFDRLAVGSGELGATTKLTDIDLTYDASDFVSIVGGLRFHRYDQTNTLARAGRSLLSAEEVIEPPTETALVISSDIFEIGARLFPSSRFQVTGGLRFQERDTTAAEGSMSGREQATSETGFFINGAASPSREWNVLAEYELGDYDNPFTRISPTRLDRFKLRVRYTPANVEGLRVTGSVFTRRFENDLTDYSLATDNYSLYARYTVGAATAYGGFTRQAWDSAIVNEVRTAPGFLGGQSFEYASLYDSRVDMLSGGFGYDVTDWARAGIDFNTYDNRGSFGQDFRQYRLFADFLSPAGYVIRLLYWRNSYDETDFDFDDYSSNMLTISVGYRF